MTTKSKISKAEIGKAFRQLEKFGYKVWNFGSKSRLTSGMQDWVDVVVARKIFKEWITNIFFIEIKIGKDKLSKGQIDTRQILQAISEKYYLVNESNYQDIIEQIIQS
jgi:hypothetical protein